MGLHISKKLLSKSEYILRHFAIAMLILTFVLIFFPVLLLIRLLTWVVVVIVIKWRNRATSYYGKLISYGDACVDECLSDIEAPPPPRMSIVATLTLKEEEEQGHPLTVEQLRKIFIRNVLKATIPTKRNKSRMRYPELQQYLSTLLGFRVWKQDPNFNIASHVVEQVVKVEGSGSGEEEDEETYLSKIHQSLLNKPYQRHRSPWEVILMRCSNGRVVLACRMHHVLGDTQSVLQLLVECLAQKPLKTARSTIKISASAKTDTRCEFRWCAKKLKFYLLFPFVHLKHVVCTFALFLGSWSHPWKMVNYRRNKLSASLVAWSPALSSNDIEDIAQCNRVSASAVIMAVCAGAIRSCQEDVLGKKNVAVAYQLDRNGHPDFLANHRYLGILKLPTGESCPEKRLEQCHGTLESAVTSHQGKHIDFCGRMAGTVIPYPLTSYFLVNRFVPVTMTNIAGDQEGFCIGGDFDRGGSCCFYPCTDFRMSVGTYKGVAGVMLCAIAYKDTVRIAVVANESVMESRQVEMLAANILPELDHLRTHGRN